MPGKKRQARKRKGNAKRSQKSSSLGQHSPSQTIDVVGSCLVPQRLSTVLRWVHVNNTLSMASIQSSYVAIVLNGIFDPLFTLGGGSPTGFTELSALYNRYIVSTCSVRMNLRNSSATAVGNDIVGYLLELPSVQTNLVGTIVSEDITEARRCTTEMIPYNNANQYKEMIRHTNIVQLEALPSLVADYEALSGSRTSNPQRTPIMLCGVTRPGGLQAGCTAEATFVVEYRVLFYQPVTFTTV